MAMACSAVATGPTCSVRNGPMTSSRHPAAALFSAPYLEPSKLVMRFRLPELARKRLGPDADLRVADLGQPLPYPDAAFDDVIASLVLHYLEDWTAPLAELHRIPAFRWPTDRVRQPPHHRPL
jgi:SAM-dependent methyltransferase